jgi:GntR family transcriptional regulator, transcriptional repressor for pyruvate dehydrogenase complex
MLKVGRSTLRESIQVLVALRLLDIRPGHGTFISDGSSSSDFNADPFSWGLILKGQSLSELIETRILIEGEIASLAAQRASVSEIQGIMESYQQMELALDEKNTAKLVEADVQFHLRTSLAAHNNVMYQTLRKLFSPLPPSVLRGFLTYTRSFAGL